MIEVLLCVLDRAQFGPGLVGDFLAVPDTVHMEHPGRVVDVDPLKFLDAPVILGDMRHRVLRGEGEVHVLVQAEHLVGVKAVLVSAGVELDALLFEFCRGPEPIQIPDGRDVARVGEVVQPGCASQAVRLGRHNYIF